MHVKHTSLQHPNVPRVTQNFSCNSYKVSDPEQCTSVSPLSANQGPTRWANRFLDPPSHPDSLAGQASDCPALHKSLLPLQCLAWKTQKYLPCTHQACFCWPGLTLVRKPQCLFPVFTALSAEANL